MPDLKTAAHGYLLKLVLAFLTFGLVTSYLVPTDTQVEILNVVALAMFTTLFVRDTPHAWQSMCKPMPDTADWYIAGTWLLYAGLSLNRITSVLYRTFDLQSAFDSKVVPLYIWLFILAAIGQLNSVHVVEGQVPRKQWTRLGLIAGVAAAMFAVVAQAKLIF